MKEFIVGRLKSLKFAIKGCFLLITTEHSVMAQTSLFSIIVFLGFYFDISKQDWINQTLAMALVLGIEGLNTAVEKMADFIHPDFHSRIGFIKDIAAGAVTFAVLGAVTIFLIIYLPYFL
ncbi:diacylglycerol kinase family protein [Psychroserpens ponticola]|uniref:Diacylglycerol kinase family protein n=1 Tax=Psychroserpens ponticola TaxID=2932268 RepID=A0ABY7S0U5_9FLAO|nr:diacylglycerol kinase family protein [Psychroserpens ponticola]WCO02758.1 diacylglycerol kinase family protein [Psychroserpens ponticola]